MRNIFRLDKKITKHFLILLIIFIITRIFTTRYFPGFSFLINGNLRVWEFLASFVSCLLLYFIAMKKFSDKYAFWTSLIYIFSPWIFYLELFKSPFLIYLFLFLVIYYLSLKKKFFRWLLVVYVFFFVFKFVRRDLFFSEVGLLNAVNVFRGEAQLEGYGILSRVIENRYFYYFLTLTVKVLSVFDPLIYFSPQAKVLPFINTPPLWLGLLPMFTLGLWRVIRKERDMLFLLIGSIPGIFFVKVYDFEKLLLVAPFIILTTTLGAKVAGQAKLPLSKLMIYLSVFLVVLQMLVFVPDYIFKESLRFQLLK